MCITNHEPRRVRLPISVIAACTLVFTLSAVAAETIKGQVLSAGAPIANSTVTLWVEGPDAPKQLDQTKTGTDGRFELHNKGRAGDAILYLVAVGGEPTVNKGGDNPAIALLTVLGSKPLANVVINEFTTVASVWTHAQFL